MAAKKQAKAHRPAEPKQPSLQSETPSSEDITSSVQRVRQDPSALTPNDVSNLQRTVGNQAVNNILSGSAQSNTHSQTVIHRKVGEIEKPFLRKSNTVSWYDWTQKGFTKSNKTVKKGTALKEARLTIYDEYAWVVTESGDEGYVRTKNLSVQTWGPVKNPNYKDQVTLDQNHLLAPVDGKKSPKPYKDTNREWYLDQAVLMEAYRSLKGDDQETENTKKQLALAMLQSFAKSAAFDRVGAEEMGIQFTPFIVEEGVYHRSSGQNPLLNKLRKLVATNLGVPDTMLQVISDPMFMEVVAREFPVFRKGDEPKDKSDNVDTVIDSQEKFGTSIQALLKNFAAGHKPKGAFVFNVTDFYKSLNCKPSELEEKVSRPLEKLFMQKVTTFFEGRPETTVEDTKGVAESILSHIQLMIISKQKGVDVLLVPPFFPRMSKEKLDELPKEEGDLRGQIDQDKRTLFMEPGSHDDRKLDSAMIESGSRMDPIAAKKAMLEFATPDALLESSGIKITELATSSAKTPTICKDIKAFLSMGTFTKFRQLSSEKDAPPYQKIYPTATADLLAGLGEISLDKGGLDQVFADKKITDVLQTAYYRMLNAMAGAVTYRGDLLQFMNNIELIHDQLQMILAIAEPHKAGSTFSTAIKDMMTTAPKKGEEPVVPKGLDPTVHHKASAMHSISSVLSSVEAQKDKEKQTRQLNALVLKDNYYEAAGAVDNAKTYDVSVLDGYKLSKDKDIDGAFEKGKKPEGPIDIYICDFHHNISVERSEYRVEDVGYQIDELYKHKLVADKFTVAIDCTVDFIQSDDIRKFLANNEKRITSGLMNVVLYRSAQKFDMLGMDNYYGGFTVTINDGKSYQEFNDRINQAEDQSSGLSHQGLSHLAKYGGKHLDEYRGAIMDNTRMLYDQLPDACKLDPTSPLYIAKTEDPRNVFLDIQFPGCSDAFAMDAAYGFYGHFIKWARSEGLAFTTRPSFGFATTNFTTIAGSKVRLNPGLESAEAISKYARYLGDVQSLLAKAQTKAFENQPKESFKSEEELTTFLDKVSIEAMKTWSIPTIKPQEKTEVGSGTVSGPIGVSSGTVKTITGVKTPKKEVNQVEQEALPDPAPIVYGDLSNANPVLYFQVNNQDGYNLRVDSNNPGGQWVRVEQFCAYLAAHWLTNGHGSGGLKFSDLDLGGRRTAVDALVSWGSQGGLVAQEQHARQELNGATVLKATVAQDATNGTHVQGTRIWFGTNVHAEAAIVLPNGNYRVYDPNTGNTQEKTGVEFTQYIQNKNSFVVA